MLKKVTDFFFLLTVFSLPFVTVFNFKVLGQTILLTEFCFLLTGIFFAVAVLTKQIKIKSDKLYIPLVLYLLVCIMATVFSSNPNKSLVKLAGIIYLNGLAFISFNLINNLKMSRKVCLVWLAGSFITAVISAITIFLFYFDRSNSFLGYSLAHYGTLPPANYPRVKSTFLIVNMFCHYLSISWMLLLVAFWQKWIGREVFYLLIVLFSAATLATTSPSIGAVLLGICLWFWVYFKSLQKNALAKVSLVSGVFCAVGFFMITTFMLDFFGDLSIKPSVRFLTWQSALETFLQNPFLGKGLDIEAARVYYTTFQMDQVLTDAHQMWLNVAAQMGIFGVLFITYLGISIFSRGLPFGFENEKAILKTGLSIAFFSAFFYQGLAGSFEDARHLWILIGFLGAVTNPEFEKDG